MFILENGYTPNWENAQFLCEMRKREISSKNILRNYTNV